MKDYQAIEGVRQSYNQATLDWTPRAKLGLTRDLITILRELAVEQEYVVAEHEAAQLEVEQAKQAA